MFLNFSEYISTIVNSKYLNGLKYKVLILESNTLFYISNI